MAAVVTISVGGASYAVLKPAAYEKTAHTVAARVDCRTVDSAIVAYAGTHGRSPRSMAELSRYVDGDITAYRIVRGRAAGPGC